MNISITFRIEIYLIILYGGGISNITSQRNRGTTLPSLQTITTTTEKSSSIESRESVKTTRAGRASRLGNSLNVTVKPDATQLKETASVESCQMRKSEKTFKWQLDECQKPTITGGKRYRKVRVNADTKRDILSLYSGMFYTQQTIAEIESARQKSRNKTKHRVRRSTEVEHDGDVCCPSLSGLEQAPDQMLNVAQLWRDIVHFEDDLIFQYIDKGYCVPLLEQSCSGICKLESRTVYLLVWKDPFPTDPSEFPLTFDAFDVPSFCSCKNITP